MATKIKSIYKFCASTEGMSEEQIEEVERFMGLLEGFVKIQNALDLGEEMAAKVITEAVERANLLENEISSLKKENKILMERLRVSEGLAETDFLTSLPNRRGFDRRLADVDRRRVSGTEIFSLLMIDIDHFKKVNDQYGHAAGDCVLKGISSILQSSLRHGDIVSRRGGEEFLILLPNTSCELAYQKAEEIRESVGVKNIINDIGVTISIGVSCTESLSLFEKCEKEADDALYKAKNTGRNKVVLYEE